MQLTSSKLKFYDMLGVFTPGFSVSFHVFSAHSKGNQDISSIRVCVTLLFSLENFYIPPLSLYLPWKKAQSLIVLSLLEQMGHKASCRPDYWIITEPVGWEGGGQATFSIPPQPSSRP